jgi:hypothetical protein
MHPVFVLVLLPKQIMQRPYVRTRCSARADTLFRLIPFIPSTHLYPADFMLPNILNPW